MDVRDKLEVIAHIGDHISYKEDIGICYDSDLAKVIEDAYMTLKNGVTVQDNTEISEELLKQLRNAPITILQEEPTVEVVQEWISVKDRLPEKDGCYIVTACDEGCSCGDGIWYDTVVIEAEHYKGEWSWNENGTEYDITCFVTHWMPLPQPTKGE